MYAALAPACPTSSFTRRARVGGASNERTDPAQRGRLQEIRDNLLARVAEAEREGWLGEVEGLNASLAGAEDELAKIDRQFQKATIILGVPTTRSGDVE
ncbi:hypothetical protein [Streptomyces sp. NPDC088736]|uniref:hypothetical protein n=1 Tax=Streptomyces sp. NPDC088736 TaxID=3365881 RepID=UPI00382F0CCC